MKGRERAEEELREDREHLRSLIESASNFAVYRLVHDQENPYKLQVVLVSPYLKEIMGIPDPMQFKSWFEHIHPDDRGKMTAANLKAFETFRFDEIYRIFHAPKGEWRWLHAVSNGVLDEEKQTRYVNGIIIDITAQKKAEADLQEALTNIKKHSQASMVSIRVEIENDHLSVNIADNGLGFDLRGQAKKKRERGMGLIIMEERAKIAGGVFVIESRKKEGTAIKCVIPVFKEIHSDSVQIGFHY